MKRLLERFFGGPMVPLRGARWVVIDCETSGLDPDRDRLIALGAVALREGRIGIADAYSAIVRQETPSAAENIVVHGIGADAQRAGRDPEEALREFSTFLGDGLPVAFHAPFDAAILARVLPGKLRWLDLARLAPVLFPSDASMRRSLDDWLEKFGIPLSGRHDALEDAFASAQLFQVLLAEAERQGVGDVRALRKLERDGRWTGRA